MLNRRDLLKAASVATLLPGPALEPLLRFPPEDGELVNDIHSQLNPTRVARTVRPASLPDVQAIVRAARPGRNGPSPWRAAAIPWAPSNSARERCWWTRVR